MLTRLLVSPLRRAPGRYLHSRTLHNLTQPSRAHSFSTRRLRALRQGRSPAGGWNPVARPPAATARTASRGLLSDALLSRRSSSFPLPLSRRLFCSASTKNEEPSDNDEEDDPSSSSSSGTSGTSATPATPVRYWAKHKQSQQDAEAKAKTAAAAAGTTPMSSRLLSKYPPESRMGKLVSTAVWAGHKAKTTALYVGSQAWFFVTHPSEIPPAMRHLWVAIKDGAHHFWTGSKLLAADVSTAARILRRVLNGHKMTRRERRQLIRTSADLFRMVPMTIIVLIPFLEFFLPVILSVFPNMLPSTFQTDKHGQAAKLKRELRARLQMAEFFNDTVERLAKKKFNLSSSGAAGAEGDASVEDLNEEEAEARALISRLSSVRSGERVSNEDVLKLARLFPDELTLDNLSRPSLVKMCEYMKIPPFGTNPFLRAQLRRKINSIKQDDKMIEAEGLDSLTLAELKTACRERGMRAHGLTAAGYRRNLAAWIDLSLHQNLPIGVLILSRAFSIQEKRPPEASIAAVISSMREDMVDEAVEEAVGGAADGELSYDKRLESVRRQNKLIDEEAKEAEAKEAAKEQAKEQAEEQAEEQAKPAASDLGMDLEPSAPSSLASDMQPDLSELKLPQAAAHEASKQRHVDEPKEGEDKADEAKHARQKRVEALDATLESASKSSETSVLTSSELHQVMEELTDLVRASAVESEKDHLAQLAEEISERHNAGEDLDAEQLSRAIWKREPLGMTDKSDGDEALKSPLDEAHEDAVRERQKEREFAGESRADDKKKDKAADEMAATVRELEAAAKKLDVEVGSDEEVPDADYIPQMLETRVQKMLADLEQRIESADQVIGDQLKLLDLDEDGLLSREELAQAIKNDLAKFNTNEEAEMVVKKLLEELRPIAGDKLSVAELVQLVEKGKREREEES